MLTLRDAGSAAVQALQANRIRSALTTLGIVIGIAAVIVGVALGNGVQAYFDEIVGPLTTQITVAPVTHVAGGGRARPLTDGDVSALDDPARAPDIASATPVVIGSAAVRAPAGERRTTVVGTEAGYWDVTDRGLVAGRFFAGDGDDREVVLGPVTAAEMFGGDGSAAVGTTLRIGRQRFRVVGVLTSNSQLDDVAVMGIEPARAYLFGDSGELSQILVRARSAQAVPAATGQIVTVLTDRHRIRDPADRDFEVVSLQNLIEQREEFLGVLRTFIGLVAAISLLVGGIGVANIMLVAVTERTPEIGLRKAVGASRGAIVEQFLTEAAMLSGAGGLAGMVLGVGLCELAALALQGSTTFPAPVVSPVSVVVSFVISVGVGLVAGSYPAGRAARLEPADALRHH
ncbi:ABC transporter permease [Pseudonocardia sp.]|uniref:ABC transporter permease n=1 Tax=Pseudonocardia sp. TaxID=60912 RepID=UPI003D0E1874